MMGLERSFRFPAMASKQNIWSKRYTAHLHYTQYKTPKQISQGMQEKNQPDDPPKARSHRLRELQRKLN